MGRTDVTVLSRIAVSAAGLAMRPAHYRRKTTPTDDSMQNNTGPLGGSVTTFITMPGIVMLPVGLFF